MLAWGNALPSVGLFSFVAAYFAAASAFLFPPVPTYPGTKRKRILRFYALISAAIGETNAPDFRASRVLHESEKMV